MPRAHVQYACGSNPHARLREGMLGSFVDYMVEPLTTTRGARVPEPTSEM